MLLKVLIRILILSSVGWVISWLDMLQNFLFRARFVAPPSCFFLAAIHAFCFNFFLPLVFRKRVCTFSPITHFDTRELRKFPHVFGSFCWKSELATAVRTENSVYVNAMFVPTFSATKIWKQAWLQFRTYVGAIFGAVIHGTLNPDLLWYAGFTLFHFRPCEGPLLDFLCVEKIYKLDLIS